MSITGVQVKLVGEDGNAFAILGRVRGAMATAKVHKKVIDEYLVKATDGDYNHLLRTTMEYVDVVGEEDDGYLDEYEDWDDD